MKKEIGFDACMAHLAGFGYQELTKTSYFGNSALDEACMVVKSWGSNRQFNLLQNEYHIGFVNIHFLHFRKLYDVYPELLMNVNTCSLNYMYNGQWVLQWEFIEYSLKWFIENSVIHHKYSLIDHCFFNSQIRNM